MSSDKPTEKGKYKKYLALLGLDPPKHPDINFLKELMLEHLQKVPFENLDIIEQQIVPFGVPTFTRRVVKERKGGFCYILNGAFADLLNKLGYQVSYLSARVYNTKDKSWGEEYDHLALLVQLDKQYLVDVGFGDFFMAPFHLKKDKVQSDGRVNYRLVQTDDKMYQIEREKGNGTWRPVYSFQKKKRSIHEFEDMFHYHRTSPNSLFTRQKTISLLTATGRITLSGKKWIQRTEKKKKVKLINGDEEFYRILQREFRSKLNG